MAKITKITERVYSGVRFALILDKRHSEKENGYPVAVRITHNYRQKYFLHGDFAKEDEFAKIAKVGKGTLYDKCKEYERFFDLVFNKAKPMIDEDVFNLSSFDIKNSSTTYKNLSSLFNLYIDELLKNDKIATATMYKAVKRKIDEYFGEVEVSKVNIDFVKKFKQQMDKNNISDTTQGIYLRHVRSICNYAIHKGLMKQSQYPFSNSRWQTDRVKIPQGKVRAEQYLEKEVMHKLYEYNGKEMYYVSLFLFSYLANGANLIDIFYLQFNDHYYKSKKRELSFVRHKTKDTSTREIIIYVPITNHLREIMKRLGVVEKRGGLLFPDIYENCRDETARFNRLNQLTKTINKHLKKACKEIGIEENISMTWARHSFKTNLIRQRVPDFYCEQAMGHSNNSVGAHYVGMFTLEDRMKYNEMLL